MLGGKHRRKPDLYQIWPSAKPSVEKGKRKSKAPWGTAVLMFVGIFIGGFAATLWISGFQNELREAPAALLTRWEQAHDGDVSAKIEESPERERFGFCHIGGGQNCVVDGDTFWMGGVKIRVADIDAPETHPSRCAHEADLGDRATRRLQELLNEGDIELQTPLGQDKDRYGRSLRIVRQNGRSVGERLVSEGLARKWEGHRQPWC